MESHFDLVYHNVLNLDFPQLVVVEVDLAYATYPTLQHISQSHPSPIFLLQLASPSGPKEKKNKKERNI
jgi:hypothetical protein